MDIEKLNKKIRECKRCRLYKTRKNPLCGEGNLKARIMLVAQAPGEEEDEEGRMFIGPSGKILDELLNYADVKREEIYMTNLIKCMLPDYRKPKQDEIDTCSYYLDEEIEFINPDVVVPLGYYATKYIMQKNNVPIPSKKEFFSVYSKLFFVENRKIFPLPHPAFLLYKPEFKKDLLKKYKKLKILNEDCKWYPVCPMRFYYKTGKLEKKWIELYCKGDWESCIRYQMEENGKYHPDYMLPDGTLNKKLAD